MRGDGSISILKSVIPAKAGNLVKLERYPENSVPAGQDARLPGCVVIGKTTSANGLSFPIHTQRYANFNRYGNLSFNCSKGKYADH